MRKTNEGLSPVGILLPSAAVGLVLTLLFMLTGAVLVQRGLVGEGMIAPLALLFLAIGSAVAALLSAKRAPGGKFLWAVGAGALVFLVLLVVGALLLRQPVHIPRTAVSALCMLLASALGGFAGVNMRKKKRYKHMKK
ncbi:TIGR04086 family membrane protein [Agathobaculum sp.]|uniref:TIGR04086 family membrane protein n=1 Tax=Agathobaculum sp. TaxID=2048138 RepID=UPI002A7F0E80|nr:TIGR04086 family membrane protein [Agathobaculum sp.]MDY3619165.1 TIGR04086 family membrane protein [Agathobaculum sp.]